MNIQSNIQVDSLTIQNSTPKNLVSLRNFKYSPIFLPKNGAILERGYIEFINDLLCFHKQRGTDITRLPTINSKTINLKRLYEVIINYGGFQKVYKKRLWNSVIEDLGLDRSCLNIFTTIKILYIRFLETYERTKFLKEEVDIDNITFEGDLIQRRLKLYSRLCPYPLKNGRTLSKNLHLNQTLDKNKIHPFFELDRLLLCNLPNQTDFAFNLCILLSSDAKNYLNLSRGPQLIKYLLLHVGIYSNDESKFYSKIFQNFESYKKIWLKYVKYSAMIDFVFPNTEQTRVCYDFMAPFNDPKDEYLIIKRISNVTSILYNFSHEPSNCRVLIKNPSFIKFILLCCEIELLEIKTVAVDVLANVSKYLEYDRYDEELHVILHLNHRLLFSNDRHHITRACEVICGLTYNASNLEWLYDVVKECIMNRMFALLHVQDIEIVTCALEVLYRLSKNGVKFVSIWKDVPKLVKFLVNFLTIKGISYGAKALVGTQVIEQVPQKKIIRNPLQPRQRNVTVSQIKNVDKIPVIHHHSKIQRNSVTPQFQVNRNYSNVNYKAIQPINSIIHHKPNVTIGDINSPVLTKIVNKTNDFRPHYATVSSRPVIAPIHIPSKDNGSDVSKISNRLPNIANFDKSISIKWISENYKFEKVLQDREFSLLFIYNQYKDYCKSQTCNLLDFGEFKIVFDSVFTGIEWKIKREKNELITFNLINTPHIKNAHMNGLDTNHNDSIDIKVESLVNKNLSTKLQNNCINLKRKLSSPSMNDASNSLSFNYKKQANASNMNYYVAVSTESNFTNGNREPGSVMPLFGSVVNKVSSVELHQNENIKKILSSNVNNAQNSNGHSANNLLNGHDENPLVFRQNDTIESGNSESRNEKNPPSHPERKSEYVCQWKNCLTGFDIKKVYLEHVYDHWRSIEHFPLPCLWNDCVDRFTRSTFSLLNHLKVVHGNQLNTESTKLIPSTVYPMDAALRAIRRYANSSQYSFSIIVEKEGHVTKHWRLTSALIIENCCSHSPLFRQCLKRYEQILLKLVYHQLEASITISKCLSLISIDVELENVITRLLPYVQDLLSLKYNIILHQDAIDFATVSGKFLNLQNNKNLKLNNLLQNNESLVLLKIEGPIILYYV
ncbi:hypothetical protein A3Q56_03450 [Intoshia linei]|uniref:ARID domain-containing protein n=1 Tax=Intoshia linei TaxID=1819745 RepID=A0A177B516_9BILA|nr:hypothetical protein A3Q56_03450 [Intoshia linei]